MPGEAGNTLSGRLIPIEYVAGLTKAQLVELLIPGEDEEDTEHLRERYLTSFRSQAFGGNVQDYLDKVGAIAGVGGCKVYPVWNGGGSVRVVVIDSTFAPPKQTLIDAVQEALDPKGSSGQGYGIAPDWAHSDSGRRNGGAHRCENQPDLAGGLGVRGCQAVCGAGG